MSIRFTSLLAIAIPLLISCQSGEKAREWHKADSTAVSAAVDTGDVWRFDAEGFLQERLSLLDAESPNAETDRIVREFSRVINNWVTDSLAETFWRKVRLDHSVTQTPLVIEIGQPEGRPGYLCRAIITSGEGRFLVRSPMVTSVRAPQLEYSALSEKAFDDILKRLTDEYRLFDMKSGLDRVVGENLAMTVLKAHYQGRSTLLLFSMFKRPPDEPARQMFDYLDSLFWGE